MCDSFWNDPLVIPSYYGMFSLGVGLALHHMRQKGRAIRQEDSETEAIPNAPFVENKSGKWCEHQRKKDGVCTQCGYDDNFVGSFVAECSCPRCGWRATHDLEPIIETRYVEPTPQPGEQYKLIEPHRRRVIGDQVIRVWFREVEPGLWRPLEPVEIKIETGLIERTCAHCGQTWRQTK